MTCARKCAFEGCNETADWSYHEGGVATCQQKAVCDICHHEYGGFAECMGGTATCTEKAKCATCGEEYGDFIENYSTGRMVTITFSENGVKASGRKKVYIMLGMNDVYLYGVDKSIENAKKLVAEIKQKSPGVEIFIQSVTPVIITKKGITNKLINKFNKKLSECCKEQKWNYAVYIVLKFVFWM